MSKLSKFLHDRWGMGTGDGPTAASYLAQQRGSAPATAIPSGLPMGAPTIPRVGSGMTFDVTGRGTADGPAPPKSLGSNVLDFVGKNWDKIIPIGLGLWNAVEGHKADKRAQTMEDEALRQANLRWQELAPLRVGAMSGLANAKRPDLSSITYDEGNPYSRSRRRVPVVGSGA